MNAHLNNQQWAGRGHIRVKVIDETPKRYRVKFIDPGQIGRRKYQPGQITLLDKSKIILEGRLCYDYHICYRLDGCSNCPELTERIQK